VPCGVPEDVELGGAAARVENAIEREHHEPEAAADMGVAIVAQDDVDLVAQWLGAQVRQHLLRALDAGHPEASFPQRERQTPGADSELENARIRIAREARDELDRRFGFGGDPGIKHVVTAADIFAVAGRVIAVQQPLPSSRAPGREHSRSAGARGCGATFSDVDERRCDRCGRSQQPADPMLASGLTYSQMLNTGATDAVTTRLPWATFEGQVICGSCQSRQEREVVAGRIVKAVENHVSRSEQSGVDPGAPEAALIELAMQLRERRELAPPSWVAQPTPAQSSERQDLRSSQVAMTAAFLTGVPLRVRIGEYRRLQEALSSQMAEQDGQGWSVDHDSWLRSGSYRSGGGFSRMLPLVVARRSGPVALDRATGLLYSRPADEQTWLAERAPGWTLTPRSARIDVYDLGMAVMNVTFEVRTPTNVAPDVLARRVKRLAWLRPEDDGGVASPIASAFRALASETTQQYATAVRSAAPHLIERPWLAPFLEALPEASDLTSATSARDWGRLLWLHPVHLVAAEPVDVESVIAQLAPVFHESIGIPGGRFMPGIGWSAVVHGHDDVDIDVPLRLLELHWAAIALFMEIDRGLLAQLDGLRDDKPHTLSKLEADAEAVFSDYLRISDAIARLESELAGLGGDEQALWDTIGSVTKLGALIGGVERKTDTLQRISERRVQLASAARSRRTSAILSFLTALTVVTVAVALITNFLGSQSDEAGHLQVRILVVLAALIGSFAVYWAAFRERASRNKQRRSRRRMSRGRDSRRHRPELGGLNKEGGL
jgi:hypothetical protein